MSLVSHIELNLFAALLPVKINDLLLLFTGVFEFATFGNCTMIVYEVITAVEVVAVSTGEPLV